MENANSKTRQHFIIILVWAFGISIGMVSLSCHFKPDTLLEIILSLFASPFCLVSWCICLRLEIIPPINFTSSIIFLLIQSFVYLIIGYFISKTDNRKKYYAKVVKCYSKTIALEPDSAVAYYKRANAYSKLKQYDKAVSDYSKFIELRQGYCAVAYLNILELSLITNVAAQFHEWIKRFESEIPGEKLSEEHLGINFYFTCIYKCIVNESNEAIEKQLNELLTGEIDLKWSFDLINEWLGDSKNGLTMEQIIYIRKLTNKVQSTQKHKNLKRLKILFRGES